MKYRQLFVLLILITTLMSCGTGVEEVRTEEPVQTEETGTQGHIEQVVIGLQGSFSSESALKHYDAASRMMQGLLHRALFRLDDALNIQPDVAQSFRVEQDEAGRSTWFIRLKEGLVFSDGKPLRSEDVVASLRRARQDSPFTRFTDSWEEVRRVSDREIAIVSTAVDNNLLLDLTRPTAYILPENASGEAMKIPGLGDYVVEQFGAQEVELARTATSDAAMERITLKAYPDEPSGILALEHGELDAWSGVSSDMFASLEKDSDYNYLSQPSITQTWLGFNDEIWPFNDANVRKAIDRALDKRRLLEIALQGDGIISTHISPWHNLADHAYAGPDLEQARAFLQKAGVRGSSIRLEILTTDQSKLLMYEVIKDDLEALGIRVREVSMDFDTYVRTIQKGDYKAYLGGYTMENEAAFMNDLFSAEQVDESNIARFSDQKVQQGLDVLRRELEQGRAPSNDELREYLDEQLPYVPLFQSNLHLIHHKDLSGVILRADGTIHPAQWKWNR